MKKILLLFVFFTLSFISFGQNPFKILNPDIRLKWGIDSVRFDIVGNTLFLLDTLVWPDGTRQWSADSLTPGSEFWKLTGDKLEPKVATNYINTDSSYYIKGIDFIRYDTTLKNQAVGGLSLYSNTTGNYNTANGTNSLFSNTTGGNNTANGYHSLFLNTTGSSNTANGYYSLYSNTTGDNNTANGELALYSNTTGLYNTANGANSLYSNTTGNNNIALGYNAGYTATLSNRLWIGQGDSTQAIIYGEMLTRPRIRINGELFATTIKTTITSDTLTDGTPTEAEINAALGLTPATATRGATYIIQDADGTLLIYDVISDGTYWHYVARTKAL